MYNHSKYLHNNLKTTECEVVSSFYYDCNHDTCSTGPKSHYCSCWYVNIPSQCGNKIIKPWLERPFWDYECNQCPFDGSTRYVGDKFKCKYIDCSKHGWYFVGNIKNIKGGSVFLMIICCIFVIGMCIASYVNIMDAYNGCSVFFVIIMFVIFSIYSLLFWSKIYKHLML